MKIYLVWERESYCDYDVVASFTNKESAELFAKENDLISNGGWITETEVDLYE